MSVTKHLFIGFGDIAAKCAEKLLQQGDEVVGIARSQKTLPNGVQFWQGNITDQGMLGRLSSQTFSSVVITLTPDARDESAYIKTYLRSAETLVALWQKNTAPERIIFVSSTRVYGQDNDEWVDENSSTEDCDAQGKAIRAAEDVWRNSSLTTCIVRFSGIYGPGRDFLIRQVEQGKAGDSHFTNRIHIEDCCGVIHLLIGLARDTLPEMVLASDHKPVTSQEIRQWLALQLKTKLLPQVNAEHSRRTGSKRCSNHKLLQLGYQFQFPTYIEGYSELLKQ